MVKEDSIKLKLSLPPSINKAYAGYPKRHKSDDYKNWELIAGVELAQQKTYSIKGDNWLLVQYQYYIPLYCKNGNKKIQDVANYEKCLSDLLAKNIVGFEDHKIKKMFLEKIDSLEKQVVITIKEI